MMIIFFSNFHFNISNSKSANHMTKVIKKKKSIVTESCYPISNRIKIRGVCYKCQNMHYACKRSRKI